MHAPAHIYTHHLVVVGIFGALTKLKSAANDLYYTSQVALGLFG